jgi:hypothetical protein
MPFDVPGCIVLPKRWSAPAQRAVAIRALGWRLHLELGQTFRFGHTSFSGAQTALSDSRRYRFDVVSSAAAGRRAPRSIKLFGAEQLTQTEESPNLPDFHQEWRRDWPYDATATGSAKAGRPGANSRSEFFRAKMERAI